MRLRNKNTGEIWDIPKRRYPTVQEDDISFFAMLGTSGEIFSYRSIAKLNEEWEDYKPAEPLIKDKKIRKVVRAWARANNLTMFIVGIDKDSFALQGAVSRDEYENDIWYAISFYGKNDSLKQGRSYTIAELCGEEEE